MKKHHQFLIAIGLGVAAGMYFGGATSTTGIYSLPLGQLLANIYTAGHSVAGGTATVTPAATTAASTTAVPQATS